VLKYKTVEKVYDYLLITYFLFDFLTVL